MVPTNSNVTRSTTTNYSNVTTSTLQEIFQYSEQTLLSQQVTRSSLSWCVIGLVWFVSCWARKEASKILQSLQHYLWRCIAYCLKVDFCCDSADVDIVATYKKASRSQKVLALNAAVRIEDAIYHKVFDFEERTQEEVTKLPGSRVLGLAKRIKIYKNLIKNTTKAIVRNRTSTVPSMEV